MNQVLHDVLVCPRDHLQLNPTPGALVCSCGHSYPVLDGVPVLLLREASSTSGADLDTFRVIDGSQKPWIADSEAIGLNGAVDPFVQEAVLATNGNLYWPVAGKLPRYPIPQLHLPAGNGGLFLDIGCNWGRWSIAAARLGYRVIGIDPWLDAVRAARRIARQLNLPIDYIVADARFLPFRSSVFAATFSYGVFQHFGEEDFLSSLDEIHRVAVPGGACTVQMANAYGLRALYQQWRRGEPAPQTFDVRYRAPGSVRKQFSDRVGPALISADGYFSLNVQPTDTDLLPLAYKVLVHVSERLRKLSLHVPGLVKAADSIYVRAVRPLRDP